MRRFFLQIVIGISGIFLAAKFIPGVEFLGEIQILLLAGTILGLINFFIKPILKVITLPLRILTFGLFSLVINMGIIWAVEVLFSELTISGIKPLFWMTILVWGLSLVVPLLFPEERQLVRG